MNLHEFEELDFEDALDLLETRLIDLQERVNKMEQLENSKNATVRGKARQALDRIRQHQADIEERLIRLRKIRAAELAGESSNLLSATFSLFDQAGERIDRFFRETDRSS